MKKIILLFIISLFFINSASADILLSHEEQCAKYIVTDESKKNYSNCIENCTVGSCKMTCWYGPEICLYSNWDKKNKTARYYEWLEKEWISDISFNKLTIIFSITLIIIFILLIYYYPKIKNKSNKQK